MTGAAPGRWRLAALFLPLAIALQLLIWRLWIVPAPPPRSWAEPAFILAPVLAAALAGGWWRSRLSATPDWAARRPYSRLMGVLLFLYQVFLNPFFMLAILLLTGDSPPGISVMLDLRDLSFLPSFRTLIVLIPSLIFQLLICLIQTEIGLFLGVYAMHVYRRGRA